MHNVYLVEIDQQPIELYKLLKIADLVGGGGEAKIVISEGYVLLNNEVEFQKRKKVYDGDYIQFGDNIIEVKFVGDDAQTWSAPEDNLSDTVLESVAEPTPAPQPKPKQRQEQPAQKKQGQKASKNKSNNPKANKKKNATSAPKADPHKSGKRRSISFKSFCRLFSVYYF